jgi:uncharacterized membrane protein
MNAAYTHIALNHIPVIGMIIGFLLSVIGLLAKRDFLVKVSLVMFVVFALFTIPVYLTGEPGEKLIMNQPGYSGSAAHEHEEIAEYSFIGAIVLGVIAILTLIVWGIRYKKPGGLIILVVIIGFIVSGLLGWTAHKGGQVRRPELRNPEVPQTYREEPQNR